MYLEVKRNVCVYLEDKRDWKVDFLDSLTAPDSLAEEGNGGREKQIDSSGL